jgi:hypothetical protein
LLHDNLKGRIAGRGIGGRAYQNLMRLSRQCVIPIVFGELTSRGSILRFNALGLPRQGP